MAVVAHPSPILKAQTRKLPLIHISFAPTISATDPKMMSRHPAARAYTAAGHRIRLSGSPTSVAIRGRAAIRIPEPMVFKKLIPAKVAMTVMARTLEIPRLSSGATVLLPVSAKLVPHFKRSRT